jgi:hypothetical protein
MPRPGLPLVHFNDTRCGSIAELCSAILKARHLADDHAERERAAAAVKAWLLAQLEKKRSKASAEPFVPERLAHKGRGHIHVEGTSKVRMKEQFLAQLEIDGEYRLDSFVIGEDQMRVDAAKKGGQAQP